MKAGARECLRLLVRYQSFYGEGNVSIRQSRIASELRKPARSVRRWLKQLVCLNLVEIKQAGPGAANYIVKKNGRALAELWTGKPRRISITELKENKPLNSGVRCALCSDSGFRSFERHGVSFAVKCDHQPRKPAQKEVAYGSEMETAQARS